MPMPKAPPKDYDADLRFDPPPKDATTEELWERGHQLVKNTLLRNRAPGRETTKTK